MKSFKRWIATAMAGLVTTVGIFGAAKMDVQAEAYWPSNVEVNSGAAVVMEIETGTILYEKNMNQSYYPASITKVMTALLALVLPSVVETSVHPSTVLALVENETMAR